MGQQASSAFCRIGASHHGAISERVGVSKLLLWLRLEPGGLEESSPCFTLQVLNTLRLSICCLHSSR